MFRYFTNRFTIFVGNLSSKQNRILYLKLSPFDEPSFQIKCSVRLKVVPEGTPGPFSEISKNFFAGIQVCKPFKPKQIPNL